MPSTPRPSYPAALLAIAVLLGGLPAGAAMPPATPAPPKVVPLLIDFNRTPEQITAACKAQLALAGKRIDAVVRSRTARTFDTVFAKIENVETDANNALAAETFLYEVSTDPKVRGASQQCSEDVSNYFDTVSARPDLYAAFVAAQHSATARGAAQRKLEELYLSDSQRSGAGLSAAQRATFLSLEAKINSYENQFGANLANDASTITITPDQAASLPANLSGSFAKDAAGNLIVPVNESTYVTFMSNEADGSARKAFYIAYMQRGGRTNISLLESAIVARDRIAALLGYPNWAAYIAADRMAQTPARIAAFLHNLDVALLPKAREQRAALATVKGAPLDAWDVIYYENQVKKTTYNVDQNVVQQYFPAPHVIDAVLGIYSKMLGLTFTPSSDLPKWNPDVIAYAVSDTKSGESRGIFYLDLYPRPGKYSHFANFGIASRRVLPNGTIQPAVSAILGNWPVPVNGKPALLSHYDVTVFFHEFGHNVAALCANTPYATLNDGFRRDFVEAPSQMLENFVWDPTILKQISSNVDTGATIPDDLIAKMNAARYYDLAYSTTGQIFYATADQRMHTLPPPVDVMAVWKAALEELTPNHYVAGTYQPASFGHLMQGYEAQYYGYLWSLVYAKDIFTAFKTGGLESPEVGARYRNDILAPARLYEPDVEVRNFLGRPMSPEPFYRELGIDAPH